MTDQTTIDREAVLAAVQERVTPEERQADAEADERAQLEQRRQTLAPEAVAGDSTAVADLEHVEARLAELDRSAELRRLAATETTKRERDAAEAETQARREQWRQEKAEAEAARDAQLARIEKTLDPLVAAIAEAIRLDGEAESLGKRLDRNYSVRRTRGVIEDRLGRRLADAGITELPPRIGRLGMEPLVAAVHECAICKHPERAEIEAAVAAGETLAAVAQRFGGFSKSTLSRHGSHS